MPYNLVSAQELKLILAMKMYVKINTTNCTDIKIHQVQFLINCVRYESIVMAAQSNRQSYSSLYPYNQSAILEALLTH